MLAKYSLAISKYKKEFKDIEVWEDEGKMYFKYKHITMWRDCKEAQKLFEDFITIVCNQYADRFWQL